MSKTKLFQMLILRYEAQANAEYKRMKELEKRCGGEGSWILK
ncbi:hypothetical protein CCACVL1_19561, partial [Corchorus capsularis]